jgi:hypothetical protein
MITYLESEGHCVVSGGKKSQLGATDERKKRRHERAVDLRVMVDHGAVGLVVNGGQVLLSHGETDRVGDTLAQGTWRTRDISFQNACGLPNELKIRCCKLLQARKIDG